MICIVFYLFGSKFCIRFPDDEQSVLEKYIDFLESVLTLNICQQVLYPHLLRMMRELLRHHVRMLSSSMSKPCYPFVAFVVFNAEVACLSDQIWVSDVH